ncbi:hypothetical protein [Tropicimonas sp. S265A]
MTNQIAIWLGLFLIAAALLDAILKGGSGLLGLARIFHDLILTLRFWR